MSYFRVASLRRQASSVAGVTGKTPATGAAYEFEVAGQHGTSVLTLDHTAANATWRQFTPYGAPRGIAPASWPDPNAFPGKPADAATGLDLIGARQYDPGTGRFLSLDPVVDFTAPQALGGYSYAAGNPVTNSDPSGLQFCNGAGYCGGGVGSSHGHQTVSPAPAPAPAAGAPGARPRAQRRPHARTANPAAPASPAAAPAKAGARPAGQRQFRGRPGQT